MNLMADITASIVPVAFVILLGFTAGKRHKMNRDDSLLITRLVLDWIFPALMLVSMAATPRKQLLNVKCLIAVLIGIMGMYAFGMVWGWMRFGELRQASLKAFVCAFPDAAFMGIPILNSLFGPSSMYPILVLNVVALLVMVPITATLLNVRAGKGGGAGTFANSVIAALQKPMVWAPGIGIAISLLGLELPALAKSSLSLIGNATSGVSLFCLGLIISCHQPKMSREVAVNVLLKNILHPGFMASLCVLFAITGVLAREIILLCALPSATITAMFANEAQAYETESATSIFISTMLSIVTLSVAIGLTVGYTL
ncbi:MAG TPA: AEC family transporter [Candidatus Acidoferrum sp.]|nr:AEC family transporter [Candidatus Eisenbacteria bacterium]HUI75944.1 AEC family transporter [Candidatus Acidoferrum sp.]